MDGKFGTCRRITELSRQPDLLNFALLHFKRSLRDAHKRNPKTYCKAVQQDSFAGLGGAEKAVKRNGADSREDERDVSQNVSNAAYHHTETGEDSDCQPDIFAVSVFDIRDL